MTHQEPPAHPLCLAYTAAGHREEEEDKIHYNYGNSNSYQNCTDSYIKRPIM